MTLPRYAPGMPLPAAPHLPGAGRPSPDLRISPAAVPPGTAPLVFAHWVAVDLHNRGFWWEAHEVWELPWRAQTRESAARHLLQGLIQLAAAHLKWHQGQTRGRRALGTRALGHLHQAVEIRAAEMDDLQMGGAEIVAPWGLAPGAVAAAYAPWLAGGPPQAAREALLAGMPPLLLRDTGTR